MNQILIYGDSLTWGIIPETRKRLPFSERWPGVLEAELRKAGHDVRVIEDCLNGRRTVWEDPFKPGRNGLLGLEQRIEAHSPLALVILMLGTNDFQSMHQHTAFHSAQGIAALVRAIRQAPIEPGMPSSSSRRRRRRRRKGRWRRRRCRDCHEPRRRRPPRCRSASAPGP
jgi:lysophospholipase L1-like esterase